MSTGHRLLSKLSVLTALFLTPFCTAVPAWTQSQNQQPLVVIEPTVGIWSVLEQLEKKHGYYVVWGHMRDGSECHAQINAQQHEFKFEISDSRIENGPLETFVITPSQRLVGYQSFQEPFPTTILNLRDKVTSKNGVAPRSVDITLSIEEEPGVNKVYITYEDRIKRKRYTCIGPKSDM